MPGVAEKPKRHPFKYDDPLAFRAGPNSMQIHAASKVGVFIEMVVSGHALGREAIGRPNLMADSGGSLVCALTVEWGTKLGVLFLELREVFVLVRTRDAPRGHKPHVCRDHACSGEREAGVGSLVGVLRADVPVL